MRGDIEFIRSLYPHVVTHHHVLHGKAETDTYQFFPYAGQRARIRATGEISFGPFGSWKFTPAGENKIAGNGSPAPGLYKNSLVAPAGRTPVYIGNDNTITAEPTPGYWLLPTTISGQTTADNGTLPSM